ncbi:MAG TPA: Mth938-like domain-containing protein [Syntrophobacteraceae bacterium]|nr:Mth938-like domain-containing protein [Syntrophobacteraceae bacterium]
MIKKYQFGSMTVGESEHRNDLKIVDGEVVASWWRREGHMVSEEDVDDILAARPETLVVGMGEPGLMQVSASLRAALATAHIQLIEEPTAQAAATFNRLTGSGRRVAGAFHLTC